MDTSGHDDLARDAERLERYAVDGKRALYDPDVAASVAAHPQLAREIDAGLARLRERISADPATSVVPRAASTPADHVFSRVQSHAPPHAGSIHRGWIGRPWLPAAVVAAAGAAVVALMAGRASHTAERASGAAREYVTQAGQRATITLADGTRIQLAPGTRMYVPEAFGRTTRIVTLDGEALFDVRHAPGAPFIVRTGTVATRVLGTTFDVRYYPGDTQVQVAVVSGKVASRGRRTFVALMAGTVGHVNDSVATSAVVSDVDMYVGWTTGRLVFRETPVPELLRVLGHWYGVEFRLSDSTLLSRHITMTLDHKSQTDAVAALESVLNVTTAFEPSQDTHPVITLRPRAKASARRERRVVTIPLEVGR